MRYAWLCHPATLVAVIVLLLNDHLLKQAWPGFVTGKLSDVAGLVVAPALLALLFARRADLVALLVTGVLFTLVKTTQTGAEVASHLWTLVAGPSRVLADPTDLLALPVLGLSWWIRGRSVPARWRAVVGVPLAVLAVTATSAAPRPSVESIEIQGQWIRAHVNGADDLASSDGGLTWTRVTDATHDLQSPTAACVPRLPQRCYRVVPGRFAVAESDDYGRTWHDSWSMPPARMDWVDRESGGRDGSSTRTLAVQDRPGGHVVVVANGVDGILMRDAGGAWRQVGWPDGGQTDDLARDPLAPERTAAWELAVAMLLATIGAGLRRLYTPYSIFAMLTCVGVYLVNTAPTESSFIGIDALKLALGIPLIGIGALACVSLAAAGRARPGTVLGALAAGPLVFATVYLPFHGWSQGTPESYGTALTLAVVLTGGVMAATIAWIRREAYLTGSRTSSPT
ncbi:hypothetical protein [Nonomuraea sediminis]|uniref:hypothetical protein n=1 Tax=Nonomuraea sediminis TaxID=2835864 RepID=UPI001BDD0B95|nr:hypothetical protein [Nonomuraea sediminis]